MQTSKLAKNMLKYLPVLVVFVATAIGLLIGNGLYATFLNSQTTTPTQLTTDPNRPQPLIVLGDVGTCGLSNIYLSLPPKCKTPNGGFIQVPGTSPYIITIPGRK